MKPWFLKGSKREIADSLSRITGDVREAIVFVDEPTSNGHAQPAPPNRTVDEMFAEMEPFTVRHGNADDSREAIYRRADGE